MTEYRRRPPTQKALPLTDWPHADRETWLAAQATAGVLDDGGMVSHLSKRTLEDLTSRFAYFLSFLVGGGLLNPHDPAVIAQGQSTRDTARELATLTGRQRRDVYKLITSARG